MVLVAYRAACRYRTCQSTSVSMVVRHGEKEGFTDCVQDVLLGGSIDKVQLGSLGARVATAGSRRNEDGSTEIVAQERHSVLSSDWVTA